MTIYRCILPDWAKEESPSLPKVVEGEFTEDQVVGYNQKFYNIYYLPNHPGVYTGTTVDGSHVDVFNYVFVDMDLKEGKWATKEDFLAYVRSSTPPPTRIVDSGNGIHVYWHITDLDAMTFLKLQRRLIRKYNTDVAVAKIYQLMRVPGTVNTKQDTELKLCEVISDIPGVSYTAEQMSSHLPPLTHEDEQYCKQHFDKTYKIQADVEVDEKLPLRFGQLLESNDEARQIWCGNTDDRSVSDFRLGHLMFAHGFSKQEAMSVLINSGKALARGPSHRINYASNIVDKIWTYEMEEDKSSLTLSRSVKDILARAGTSLKGTRFPCHKYIDNTEHGFRLGQVIGLVAGSGVGKTAMALNMFMGFVDHNPDYEHFFIPLEQPTNEIADRWKTLCGNRTHLHEKVHLISNYDDDGGFRHLSLGEIREYVLKFQEVTGKKVGCIVIDHIGALKKKGTNGENQDLMDICHSMKSFAIETNTMLVMQSQAPREKAGGGDLELDKDAAYGTVYFESYCDYLITIWQPLKKVYKNEGCPTVTAFKFCKIRHKKQGKDVIQEDELNRLFFNPDTGVMRELTEQEELSFDYFNKQAVNLRKKDRKTEITPYKSSFTTAPKE